MLNDCTMTVNGTDFRIPQKRAVMKGNAFASHKYAGKSALRYKLGVDILAGNLVWIQCWGLYAGHDFHIWYRTVDVRTVA